MTGLRKCYKCNKKYREEDGIIAFIHFVCGNCLAELTSRIIIPKQGRIEQIFSKLKCKMFRRKNEKKERS